MGLKSEIIDLFGCGDYSLRSEAKYITDVENGAGRLYYMRLDPGTEES